MKSLRQYWHFFETSFRNHLAHRGRVMMRFIFCIFFVIIFVELWRTIFRENLADMPFTLRDVSWYCALTQMFLFMSSRLFITIEDDVRTGNIAYFLNRPMPYVWMRLSEGIGAMSANVMIYGTLGVGATYLWIGELPSNPYALPAAILTLWMGSVLHLMFQICTGLTALWLHDAEAVYRLYQKFLIVAGGLYVPISIYPEWAQNIIAYTPFHLLMFGPAQLTFGTPVLSFIELLALQTLWIVIAGLTAMGVYTLALKRVEINGG